MSEALRNYCVERVAFIGFERARARCESIMTAGSVLSAVSQLVTAAGLYVLCPDHGLRRVDVAHREDILEVAESTGTRLSTYQPGSIIVTTDLVLAQKH
jgi:hypothetical protein